MYFSIFSSSEYYSDENINTCSSLDDKLCLICWLPEEEKNEINLLSNFSHIKPNCKCKPNIHLQCLNEWITKSPTCPICRTKMNIIVFTRDEQTFLISCYINCIGYTIQCLKILSYASFINFLCLLVYNMYNIYYMTNKYYEDDYGIY
jgi:hypothetical protein